MQAIRPADGPAVDPARPTEQFAWEVTERPPAGPDPTAEEACLLCTMARKSGESADLVVFEDEQYLATHQLDGDGPHYLGAVLLQTKRHVTDLGALTRSEAAELGTLLSVLSRGLLASTGAAWTYVVSFTEAYRHIHLIITARYPAVPAEFVRLAISDWPLAPRGDRGQVAALCQRLRDSLSA